MEREKSVFSRSRLSNGWYVCPETDIIIYRLVFDGICLGIKAVDPFVSIQGTGVVRMVLMYGPAGDLDVTFQTVLADKTDTVL